MDDGSKLLLMLKTFCWHLIATEREAAALTFDLVTPCYVDNLRVEAQLKTKRCAVKSSFHFIHFLRSAAFNRILVLMQQKCRKIINT